MKDATVQKPRTRAVLFGAVSLLLAAGTALTVWQVVERYEGRLERAGELTLAREVVLAARELRPGQVLTAEDLRTDLRVLSDADRVTFSDPTLLVGEQVGDRILEGEVIRRERLLLGGAQLKANEIIDPGSRAITVWANRESSVGGLLEPGFFVDVIVTIRPETNELTADWVTETILQGVRVVAVNDQVFQKPEPELEGQQSGPAGKQEQRRREAWVTLEVEPSEAEQLAMAAARGMLHLTLRAVDDFDLFDVGQPLVTNALVGLPTPVKTVQAQRLARKRAAVAPVAPETPPAHVTDVIRGGELTTEAFDEEGHRIAPAKGGAGRR